MNKRFIILLIITLTFISACEKDDFCTDPKATPKLVLRFYDKNTTSELKKAARLSIIAASKTDSLITNQTIDSIALPLNTLATETVYTLKTNSDDGNMATNKTATLTIAYDLEEEFISRSCGFRIIYNEVTLNQSGEWIDSISTNTISTIDKENKAHVQVYH